MNSDRIFDYPFTIRLLSADDGGGYLIEFPDLPGCMSDGETIKEAIENGKDAFQCCMLAAKESGRDIPKPER
jgi:antitoxin HicB